MNWYKKSQQFEESPKWEYPGAEHDYDPNWDYEMNNNPDQQIVQYVEQYINKLKKELLPQIGFIQDIKVGFVQNDGKEMIARYISGTQPWVVILIDIERTREIATEYGSELKSDLEMSILHELAHGIQEGINFDMDEREAEEFAYQYQFLGELWRFWDDQKQI
ncbi:MAG: hypothetical protein ACTSSP_00355 [Candidatus Asgardarchaeia archaeon]